MIKQGRIAMNILAPITIFGSLTATIYLELSAILPNVVETLASSAGMI